MSRMTWPPLEGIDPPCCRACGREPATCFDMGLVIERDDGDVDIEPNFPMCDRCYRITGPFDNPPDLDAVDRTVVALREDQIAIVQRTAGKAGPPARWNHVQSEMAPKR